MIKGKRLLPIKSSMAALAVFAQSPQMRILFRMATCAGCVCAAKLVTVAVAPGTGCFDMSADQWVICQTMVEAGFLERNEREVTTVMFAMTGFARLRPRSGFAMKSRRLLNVGGDPLMT